MNFLEFIAVRVVQQHDNAVVLGELLEGCVELLQLLEALLVSFGVLGPGEPGQALAGQKALVNDMHAAAGEASLFVDEQVVHDARQPRARLID